MGSIAKFHLAGVLCQVMWKAEFQNNAHFALVRNRACYVPAQSIFYGRRKDKTIHILI